MSKRFFTITIVLLFTTSTFGQTAALKQSIQQLLATKNATVGVAILGLENKDSLSINGAGHFPLQSVFKFHIALAVLHAADEGRLGLHQKLLIKKSDLLPDTYSPLRDKYPSGNVKLPLSEIIQYSVSESDNNACDFLIRLIGGPKAVNDYLHSIGIEDIAINASEADMHKGWDVQFTNWTSPLAAVELLQIFYSKKILSAKSHQFLWKTMLATSTGKKRLKGQLPAGTPVAHKTGTSDIKEGVTAAINDIGIVTLPNGQHFAISVFVSNTKENDAASEKIIADIAKLAWGYFVGKAK